MKNFIGRALHSFAIVAGLAAAAGAATPPETGLLFYLSGDHGFTADWAAGGTPEPNYIRAVGILEGGYALDSGSPNM